MPEHPSRGRATLLTTLGVLAALALVAVASRGATETGGPGARKPSETLLDVLVSLYVIALALGVVMLVVLLVLRRHARGPGSRGGGLYSFLVSGLLVLGLLLALRYLRLREPELELPELLQREPATRGEVGPGSESTDPYQAEFAWIPMLVLGGLVLVAGLAWWYAGRARRLARVREREPTFAEALADVLAETLDELRADPDARRAVIRAYARLERAAAASGVPRRAAEAPLEYLRRMLAGLEVGPAAAQRLTVLFERAKFSHHDVDATMKQDAIHALELVLEDLQQAELRARQEREAALAAARERARERVRA